MLVEMCFREKEHDPTRARALFCIIATSNKRERTDHRKRKTTNKKQTSENRFPIASLVGAGVSLVLFSTQSRFNFPSRLRTSLDENASFLTTMGLLRVTSSLSLFCCALRWSVLLLL
jgi:hypothetical protein